jgi:hypothetical protein
LKARGDDEIGAIAWAADSASPDIKDAFAEEIKAVKEATGELYVPWNG